MPTTHARRLPGPRGQHRRPAPSGICGSSRSACRTRSRSGTSSSGWPALLPQNGLIVDVRDNGGGHIYASEFTLQTMTPRRIAPEPVQFISTPLNLAICRRHTGQPGRHRPRSVVRRRSTRRSRPARPSRPPSRSPRRTAPTRSARRYHGPVVLVTDARVLLGHRHLRRRLRRPRDRHDPRRRRQHRRGRRERVDPRAAEHAARTIRRRPRPRRTSPCPNGANMRVAIRRTLRVGALSGTPVEDLGVTPTRGTRMTRPTCSTATSTCWTRPARCSRRCRSAGCGSRLPGPATAA